MRLRRIKIIIILVCSFYQQALFSQTGILENNPPNLNWNQINTPNFRIIFNENLGMDAQKLANSLEHLYNPVSQSLNQKPRKISVILQNQNVIPNGFVSQTPRRSEFYTMPPQDYNFLGTLSWLDLLAVHEYRHVVQFDKSITGFNKFLHIVFGYDASSSMAHMAVPEWFWEGDAVNLETALTNSGRGRIPNFSLLMRANTMERGPFNYYRQYLRSFKYNIQNHYVTGYYLTAYIRRQYGENTIEKVTEGSWAWPFIPFRFSSRLKKYTGKYLIPVYNDMITELDSIWKNQIEDREPNQFHQINQRESRRYIDYLYPHFTEDGHVVAMKMGIGDIASLVVFDEKGKDHKVFVPGLLNETGMMSAADNKIVWNEFEFDPRHQKKTYSVIKLYDLESKKHYRLTKKSRYGSAALSPDGTKIVTVETTQQTEHHLLIIHSKLGWELERIPNPENDFFIHPRWSEDGKYIISIKQNDQGKTIMIYNTDTREQYDLWPLNNENIGYPVMYKSFVLYNSPYDGIDNIYVYDLLSNRRFRITNSKYGAYNAQVFWNGKKIIYNDFSKEGHNIVEIDLNPNLWMPIDDVKINEEEYIDPIVEQEGHADILLKKRDSIKYPTRRYRISKNIINPYSWGPMITSTDLEFLVGLRSQDIMSTTFMNLGYEFNANESHGRWLGSISYQGLYPALNLNGYLGDRSASVRLIYEESGDVVDTIPNITWKERGAEIGFQIPLILIKSKYLENLDIGMNYNYTRVYDYSYDKRNPDMQGNGDLFTNTYYFSYRRNMKRSRRDLYGKFGQNLFIQYEHTPYGGDYLGGLFAGEIRLIFPGLFKHHAFQIRSSFLQQDLENGDNTYLFQSPVLFTRGYSYMIYERYYNNSVNYALPLLYPDVHIGPLLNVQRIYTNLFFDYGINYFQDDYYNFRSIGAEVSFDFNLLRYLSLFNLGFRYSYAMDNDPTQQHRFQLLIGNFGF